MKFYAHTHPDYPTDQTKWEPLFTPFGKGPEHCQRNDCNQCADLDSSHGHLNKVAWWTAKFAAEKFRLIDSATHSILIPWGIKGKALCQEIRLLKIQNRVPNRSHYHRAQQFIVQVYDHEWQCLKPQVSLHCDEAFAILEHPENNYHPETGLKRPNAPDDPSAFCL